MSENDADNKESSRDSSKSSVPSWKSTEKALKIWIHSAVESTNSLLARMEETTDKTLKPVVDSARQAEHQGELALQKASKFYEMRRQYGPQLVLGTSLFVGAVVGLRRGRVPAVAGGFATGMLSYLLVYEIDMQRLPDVVFGKEGD